MNIIATFNFENRTYRFSRSYKDLDRNYMDEDYAYFFENRPNSTDGYFEINILKNSTNGNLIEEGYVSVYDDTEQILPDEIIEANIEFIKFPKA